MVVDEGAMRSEVLNLEPLLWLLKIQHLHRIVVLVDVETTTVVQQPMQVDLQVSQ